MSDTKQMLLEQVMGTVEELENDTIDPAEWLEEQLSIETFMISPDGAFQGAEVLCAFGGPNVWVDTKRDLVIGSWGGDTVERGYTDQMNLHEYLEEIYASAI